MGRMKIFQYKKNVKAKKPKTRAIDSINNLNNVIKKYNNK
jgi:hypothetical protein